MNLFYALSLIVSFVMIGTCSRKEKIENLPRIGEFYIYKSALPVYESADRTKIISKVNVGDKVEIVESNIPDKIKGFWYKVIHTDKVGYIPLSEETSKNLVAFLFKSEQGRITASSLRIRETPDLTGKVLGSVPKGTIVQILSQGLVYEKIDDKFDTWMKIKTDEGVIGYSYAGYISKNLDPDTDEVDATRISAYVEIIEEPKYLVRPGGRDLTDQDPAPCGTNSMGMMPGVGGIHKTEFKYTEEGVTYYKIEYAEDSHGCYDSYRGWISEKQVVYIDDIYKYTSQKYGSEYDKAFLDVINENSNRELNVKTLKVEPSEFKVKEPGYTFYEVQYGRIYYKYKGNYYYAGEGWGDLVDVNNDGTNEIISGGDCACMCSEARVTVWNNGKLETIFNEYPEASLRWEVGNNYLTAIRSADYDYESKGVETYYEIKNNMLNQLAKKPSKASM
ncbi:MAG: SH3 domain-containing protein [Leptospira sp.]|nr:SH3 domain-containing protein [Leptospira sp.]